MDSLHLTTAHTPTDNRIFLKEATSLANAGLDVGVLAHDVPKKEQNGVEFIDLGSASNRVNRWRSIPKTAQIAKQLGASVYHFHDPELIPVGLYLAERTDGSVVYDIHENYGQKISGREWVPNWIKSPMSHTIPQVERFAANRFDAIISATDRLGERFTQLNNLVTTLHNFPRVDSLRKKKNESQRTPSRLCSLLRRCAK